MQRASELRRQGHDRSLALKAAWAEFKQWKSAQASKHDASVRLRQTFFLRRREELKEERRLETFNLARARAGSLSRARERQWSATDRKGGSMTDGLCWERHEAQGIEAA